jgi:small neutral amino acid transporter SnatA (MarC family)
MRSRLNFVGTALIGDWLLQTPSISLPELPIAGGRLPFSIALFQIRNTARPGTP